MKTPKLFLDNRLKYAGIPFFSIFQLTSYGSGRKISLCTTNAVRLGVSQVAKSIASLGEFEIKVLRLVWQNQPCTERQISDMVKKDRAVARTTVLKTLQRLEAKGLLARAPGEPPVRFRAVADERRVVPALIGKFVDGMLGGSPGPLLAYFADSGKLSDKDLKTLQTIVQKISQTKDNK
jgi:predicted transcriptional regulator